MKNVIVLVAFVFLALSAQAQKAQWATIKVPQLKCWDCKERLDKYLSREKGPNNDAGIIRWTFQLQSATLRVQYYPERINLNYIQTAIANAGFDADEIKAEEEAYKKLPPICKRAEDGGGPKPGRPCHTPPM